MNRARIFTGAACVLLFATNIHAVDGVVLIDQARALAGNVTPGDTPGFPVTISLSGSYRLAGNLTVPGASTSGIAVSAVDVTIDLNGFAIIGSVACTGGSFNEPPLSCSSSGTGNGISGGSHLTVTNGTIRGMGNAGVLASENCRIEKVHAIGNAGNGFITLNGCVVTDNVAMRNGKIGYFGQSGTFIGNTAYANGETGFSCTNTCQIGKAVSSFNGEGGIAVGGGSVIVNNSLFSNKQVGITAINGSIIGNTVLSTTGAGIFSQGGLVKDNLVRSSSGLGLSVALQSGVSGNVFQENNGGNANPQIGGTGLSLGQNVCGASLCP